MEKPVSDAESAVWRFPPDIESEITTLATVCQVKPQQGTEYSSSREREEDIHRADSSDDEEGGGDSNFATDAVDRREQILQRQSG